ncbi:DUF3750 domain-containing protein, partial [Cronobacter sakazakii]
MFLIKTLLLSFLCITLLSFAASVGQKMYHNEPLSQRGWWAARSDSAGLAPDPRKNARLALVQ